MATSGEHNKVIYPFMPSLFHLSLVRTALPFFYDFDIFSLEKAYEEIQLGNSACSNGSSQENFKANAAKERLLFVPTHLRQRLLRAVAGLNDAVDRWNDRYGHITELSNKNCRYWRSEGTIDATRLAQQLILDENINLRDRFYLACMFCLETSVRTLWEEVVKSQSGNAETFDSAYTRNNMMRFWIRWLREGCQVPWLEAAKEYLEPHIINASDAYPNYSCFFPLLTPKDRKKFLSSMIGNGEDYRLCLYSATKEEEKQMLKANFCGFMYYILQWPFQISFLETAEKLWDLIGAYCFNGLLLLISALIYQRDFDYCQLLIDLWHRSPQHLKESAKECPHTNRIIKEFLNEIRQKRKKQFS